MIVMIASTVLLRPILGLGLIAAYAVAQQRAPAPQPIIRIDVNLVQIDAVVTDSKGKHVPDLTAKDFEILQDGRAQQISHVEYVRGSAVPGVTPTQARLAKNHGAAPPAPSIPLKPENVHRTFAMVVDDLGMSVESIAHVRDALKNFVDRQMQPGDLVAIVRTSAGMGAFQQFTNDKRLLHASIDRIKFSVLSRTGAFTIAPAVLPPPRPPGFQQLDGPPAPDRESDLFRVGTLGAISYIIDGLRELPGRKSVVLFSESMNLSTLPGNATDATVMIHRLIDAANRAAVVIDTVDPRGLLVSFPGAADDVDVTQPHAIAQLQQDREGERFTSQTGLAVLAQETGGLFIKNDNFIDDAMRLVLDDSVGYYLIAYTPSSDTFDPRTGAPMFHKLKVRVKTAGLRVRTRSGFFGVSDTVRNAAPVTVADKLRYALASPFASGEVQVRLTTAFSNTAKQGSYLRALLYIEPKDLRFFEMPDGSHEARIDILLTTFGNAGKAIDSVHRNWSIHAEPAAYADLLKNGVICSLNYPVKKGGAYQMRAAVIDSFSDKVGTASQFIEIPDVSKKRLTLSSIFLGDQAKDAERVFAPGAPIDYEYQIFNARTGGGNRPDIEVETRLFRDGKEVYSGQPIALGKADFSDPSRVRAGGHMQLASQLPAGDYVMQLIVTDKLADPKNAVASQWIDFEVTPHHN